MALPLFYSNITALDRELHRKMKAPMPAARFGFSATSHLIPCVIEEFGLGALELPILFVPTSDSATPVFLVGYESGRNMMLHADGSWGGRYIPAYLRRFPFIMGDADNKQSVFCADLGQLSADEGEALFTETGEGTAYLNTAIDFVNRFSASARQTEAFVQKLLALKLLASVTVDFRNVNGNSFSIHGLLAVDEKLLATLSDEAFLELRQAGYLPLIYAHRNSLANIQTFSARLAAIAAAPVA